MEPARRPGAVHVARVCAAVAEYEQDLGIRPGTLCVYDVQAEAIVDLTDARTLGRIGIDQSDLAEAWKQTALIQKRTPQTSQLADRLIEGGANGVRVRSVRTLGVNLVLWRWNAADDCRVRVLDPLGDLPRAPR